ncbi:YbaN family protein [Sphingomonas sp. JC676]|uniref:YbaN family protein n=1 Tax=Sphingomonas sp. JC676 TaxID=2768065 RepID=UPI001657D8AE|nr:YbaN family protein [Sphingomonas sp. JC676]MBC9031168.1 YbaN family protein [Sphingomonas sp. JC676]
MTTPPEPIHRRSGSRASRALWLALGWILVSLGIIGAFLPLMPTTIFLILAAGCFARSSPRLEARLLEHPRFGSALRAWRAGGAISRKAKYLACAGMMLGYAIFWWTVRPGLALDLTVAGLLVACAAFVVSRPVPRQH